jgi:bisphosphoglycerate-independent phosphoglycerate mutase (AlkP superfamily)
VPEVSEEEAGANLAAIANGTELTLYAHYTTDTAGHRKDMDAAVGALQRVDRFLRGVTDAVTDDTLVFIASDHGNVEDVRTGHTLHPALGVAWGPGAERLARARDLRDVAPALLELLQEA